jgi:hypothetical protein
MNPTASSPNLATDPETKSRPLPFAAKYAVALVRGQTPLWLAWLALGMAALWFVIFAVDPSWSHFFTAFVFLGLGLSSLERIGVQFLLNLPAEDLESLKLKGSGE